MKNLFTSLSKERHKTERPIVRNVTAEFLEGNLSGASAESWMNEPIGSGLKNTQQLLVDWDDFSKHVFFNSAEAKVNLAFDQLVNGYPFDGTSSEKREFMSTVGGYTNHILGKMDAHKGYLNLTSNTMTYNASTTRYAEVIDHTGYLAPDLATVQGDAKASRYMNVNGSTHEFWVYIPDAKKYTDQTKYSVIYQKSENPEGTCSAGSSSHEADEDACIAAGHTWTATTNREVKKAITILHGYSQQNPETLNWEYDVHFMIGSGNFKSIVHSVQGLEHDKWHHVAFVYERSISEKVLSYVNGRYVDNTSVNQAELDDITTYRGKIRIGWSDTRQIGYASSFMEHATGNDPVPFQGMLDEIRVWLGPRSPENILRYYKRNVDNQPSLLICYRCNEPKTDTSKGGFSYGAKTILLDYSGNSLHNRVLNYDDSVRNVYVDSSGEEVSTAVSLEKNEDNKVLFPDWPPNQTMNQTLLLEGNHYDRNNPNLITNLVPRHYFEEATFFEGVEKDWEEPDQYNTSSNPEYPIPGHGEMPARLVMMSFLLVWANFFDDIKLYLDHFSLIDKVSYDNFEQIPPQLITFLSDYYGISLPDPYTNETPDRYQGGENIEIVDGVHVPLKKTIDSMWRRVLINLPFLLRSRGTVQGIKALFNTLGIESDGIFKFREFGGNLSNRITSSRRKRKKRIKSLDFKQISFAKSNSLWAYRHEPGAPDSAGAPVMSSINMQFGDIVYDTPAGPPVETQYTSGSWSWEGRYTLDPSLDTCSLFRIERDSEILVNLVAHKEEDTATNELKKSGLQLHFDGHTNATNPIYLELDKINLWDGSPWHICVYHQLSDNPTIGLRIMKASDRYIVEDHHAFINLTKDEFTYDPTTAAADSGPPLYWFGDAVNGLGGDPNTLRYYIGDSGASYSGTRNPSGAAGTQTEHARTVAFSGLCSHLRFWTKNLDRNDVIEHTRNPFSMAIQDPITGFAFLTSPLKQLNSNTGLMEKVPLEKFQTIYEHGLPQGSWERLRQSFDMLQGETTVLPAGSLEVIDTSQNDNNLTIYSEAGNQKCFRILEMTYNISSTDFDFNSASNKVRIRSFQDKQRAKDNFVRQGKITTIPSQIGIDDRRFSIESSLVHALNEDMLNITGDSDIFNNYLGYPELEYALQYPELTKLRDLYFERIVGRVNYNSVIEFQRWFNGNFASLVEQFIPHTADFLGINFVIESHMLERHKFEYKQGDVHVDVKDRVAFEQVPIFIGLIKSEIV